MFYVFDDNIYLCLYKFIPCAWPTLQMAFLSVNVGECVAWDNKIYIVLLSEDWRISLSYIRKSFNLRHRICDCRVLSKTLFRRQIKLSKAGASINLYNLRNCPKSHFLRLHLQYEKKLKTVEYDQDEEQVAANRNYADVQETCLSPVSISKVTSLATTA